MSSIVRKVFGFFFGENTKQELEAKDAFKINSDWNNLSDSWTKSEEHQTNGEPKGGGFSDDHMTRRPCKRKLSIERNSVHDDYDGPPPPKINHIAAEVDEGDCVYSDCSEYPIKLEGMNDLENKRDDTLTKEKDAILHGGNEICEKDNINRTDTFYALGTPTAVSENTYYGVQETPTIVPDPTFDVPSEDNRPSSVDCSFQKGIKVEGVGNECSRESFMLPVYQNDAPQTSTPPPSMLCLNTSGIGMKTQVLTVIPVDKMLVPQSGYNNFNGGNCTNFLVMTGDGYSTPISTTPQVQEAISKATVKEESTTPTIQNTDRQHPSFLPCKELTLGEMYEKFNRDSHKNTTAEHPKGSPKNQTKKLLDVNLHSRLEYLPKTIQAGTQPCNPASSADSTYFPRTSAIGTPHRSPASLADSAFSTAHSCARTLGMVSPALPSPKSHAGRTPQNYFLNVVNRRDTTVNKKIVLIKSIDFRSAKNSSKKSLVVHHQVKGSAGKTPTVVMLPPASAKNKQPRGVTTPKSSTSRSLLCTSGAQTYRVGTPRPAPAPTASTLGGSGSQRVGEVRPSSKDDQLRAKKPATSFGGASESKFLALVTPPSSCREKARSATTRPNLGPSQKKVEGKVNSTPRRSSRIPASELNARRVLRRTKSVVYKI